jgi:ribosomal protein S18 acetylase RimI-like enzyme
MTSAFWWLLGRAGGVEAHHVFGRDSTAVPSLNAASSPGEVVGCVDSPQGATSLGASLRDRLEQHFSRSLAELVGAGGRVYFLAGEDSVLSQLLISPGPHVTLDAPHGIELDIGVDRAFLSYLYTPQLHRRTGAAKRLMRLVLADIAERWPAGVIAHVRATNVPSLNAFRTGGWEQIGTFWTRSHGDWLRCVGLERRGIAARRSRHLSAR